MGDYDIRIGDDSGFSLDEALNVAVMEYTLEFEKWWGFDTNQPPEAWERDDWIELQKSNGLAKQVAEVASTLLQRKGLGKERLTRPAMLASESREAQERMRELGKQLENLVPAEEKWRIPHMLL